MTTSSTTDPVSVLEGMYAAEAGYLAAGQSSFAPLAPFFAEDVVLHQADALPYGGTWRGHEGMARFFEAMGRTWAGFDLVEQDYLATTSPLVVRTRVRARSRDTGHELEFLILQTITVEDGRITEVRPFYWDTAAIARACGTG
ncbi:nuclear transport factor 2 family protein [Amycolatopsis magusensis]|uniref:nuclear transport factor 2 family protein n=1 Tax=Amycolatopsis magusensis TaxID=882444 RepID=UPI003C2C6057